MRFQFFAVAAALTGALLCFALLILIQIWNELTKIRELFERQSQEITQVQRTPFVGPEELEAAYPELAEDDPQGEYLPIIREVKRERLDAPYLTKPNKD